MKAKLFTFVRGLKNGTPPRFQSYLKSLILLGFLTIGISQVWGDEVSFIFTGTNANCSSTSGTVSDIEYESGKTGNAADCVYNTTNGLVLYYNSGDYGYFNNKTSLSSITKIEVTTNNKKNSPKYKVYGSKDKSTWTQIGSETSGGNNFSESSNAGYSYIQIRSSASGQLGINSVTITYGSSTPAVPCSVTYHVGSTSQTLSDIISGTKLSTALKDVTTTSCDDYSTIFIGWSTASITGKVQTSPTSLLDADATVTEDMEVWAVWAHETITPAGEIETIWSETFGDAGSSSAQDVSSYTGFSGKETGISYTASNVKVSKNTNNPCSLTGSSGKSNLYPPTNNSAGTFTVEGLNTLGYENLTLSFNFKYASTSSKSLTVTVNSQNITASSSNNTNWQAITCDKNIPSVQSLTLAITGKSSGGFNLDDIKLTGNTPASATYSDYLTTCCTSWLAPTLSYTTSASIGAQLNPSWGAGDTHGTLTYSSSDEDVLEVDENGVVTTKAAGTAHVIASWSSTDGYCDNSTTSNEITVTAAYNITYKDKGGADFSGTHEDGYPQTHTYGTATTLKGASKDYYKFDGWFANESCTGNAIQTVAADAYTADFTLYAKWTPIVYNIKYTLNGGTNASSNPATYTYETATITLQDPSKIGHDFQGWFKESTFENEVKTIEQGSHGNVDLYANWSVKSYTLTWDLNGGSVTTPGTTAGDVAFGTALTAPAVERTGYKFTGWKKGNTSIDFTNTVTMPAENATYVAQWTAEVYNISYQDQGGEIYSGSNEDDLIQTHTYDKATTLVAGVKAGYEFKGWFEDAACEGTAVETIAGDAKTEDFTLYAKWEEILPTSFDVDVDNLTLVYDDENNKVGYIQVTFTPNNAFNREVKFEAVKNEGSVVTAYNYGGNDPKLRITANKEGEAIYKITSKRDESLTKTINITVKRLPVLTWKDANGDVVATTKAPALNNGKVVLPKEVDYSKTPATCNDEYDHFMGWSATQFNATTDEPTLVEDGDDVNSDSETGDKTYYAVFAKGTGSPVKYTLVTSNADIAANNTYVIGHVTSEGDYYYLPTTSTSSNPVLKSLSVVNGEIFGEIAEDMPWTLVASNNETYPYYIQSENQKTNYFYQISSNGASFKVGTTQMPWNIVKDDTYGWKITNNATYTSKGTTYGNPMYAVIYKDNETTWRNYKDQTTNALSGAKFAIFKKSGGVEYHDFLTSCCQGYAITLDNGGTATGGTFSADVESACEGETVTLTATPATGYEFVQWTVKSDDEQTSYSVTDNKFEMPANGVKVSALFGKINYTVSLKRNFESTDDTYTTEAFTYQETKALTTMATIGWTKTNYKFSGWSTTPSGSVEYVDGAEYKLEEAQNKTLYAIWTADDAQPISISQEHMTLTNAPTSISAAATQLKIDYSVATGYKITNVEVTVGGQPLSTIEYTQYQLVVNASDGFQGAINITFTVEEIVYMVTLDAGTGSVDPTSVTQEHYGNNVTLPAATTSADGWTFAGWAAAKVETETETAPTLYTGNYTPTADITLYAVYKRGEEVIGDTYTCDFETKGEPEGWAFNKFEGNHSSDNISPVSGSYMGKTTITSSEGGSGYVLLDKAITGKYRITASVARISSSTKQGKYEIKIGSGSSWTSVGTSVNVASATQNEWQTLTWTGDLNNQMIEVYYTGGSNATRVIDNVIVEEIANKSYYHSTPSVLTSLTVKKAPAANIKYKVGETFNPNGIELTAVYDNDESTAETITEGFDYDIKTALPAGETLITFTYKKATCTQKVTAGILDHITITTVPTTLTYTEGETFSNAGLVTRAYYKYNDEDVCSESLKKTDLTYSPSLTTSLKTTDTYVRISYTWAGTTVYVDQPITVIEKVATPTFSPDGGKLTEETPITISCATEGATIYYTTDGSLPTKESSLYENPVPMLKGTLRAIAVKEGWGDSEVGTAVFIETIDPTNGDWILVTDASQLAAGDFVIIASNAKGIVAGKTEGSNLARKNATFSEDKSMLTYTDEAMILRLGGEAGAWTLTHADNNDHIMGATGNTTLTFGNTTTATNTWTIAIDGNNNATISNTNSNCGRILDNTAHYYTIYKDAAIGPTMLLPQLYKYYHPTHKIIYNANGVNVKNLPTPTRAENGKAVVTDKQPTWGGYEFVKWTADKEGLGKVYTAGEEVALTADLTIYAQWQEKELEGTPVALVVKYGDKYYAMGKDLSAVEVEDIYNGNVVVVSEEVDQKAITWYRNDVDGGVIFQNCEEKYLQGASSTNLNLVEKDIATIWNWDNDKQYYYTTVSSTVRTFFLQGTEVFKNYAVSNISSNASAATCCESFRVGEVFTRDMSNGNMGTHCYPFDIAAGDYKGAQFYEIAYHIGDTRIYFDQVDHVEAGVPYLVVPEDEENGSILEAIVTPKNEEAKSKNGFVGSYVEAELAANSGLYIVYNNEFRLAGNYVSVGANRAYIKLDEVPTNDPQQGMANAPRRISLRNSNAQAPTGIDNVVAEFGDSKDAKKVIVNGNFYIIKNDKVYGAQGQLIKKQ